MISLLALIILPNISYGQNFMKQFEELFSKKDTVGQIQLLNNWEKTNSNDPELYVAYYIGSSELPLVKSSGETWYKIFKKISAFVAQLDDFET